MNNETKGGLIVGMTRVDIVTFSSRSGARGPARTEAESVLTTYRHLPAKPLCWPPGLITSNLHRWPHQHLPELGALERLSSRYQPQTETLFVTTRHVFKIRTISVDTTAVYCQGYPHNFTSPVSVTGVKINILLPETKSLSWCFSVWGICARPYINVPNIPLY